MSNQEKYSLYEITAMTQKLEELLYKEEIAEEDAEVLKQELVKAFKNKSDGVMVVLNRMDDNINAITERARRLRELKKYYTNTKERLRAGMLEAMKVLNLKRIDTPEGIISRRKSPGKLVIKNETKVPDKYTKITIDIDNTALKKAVKSGDVDSSIAVIEKPDILSIR